MAPRKKTGTSTNSAPKTTVSNENPNPLSTTTNALLQATSTTVNAAMQPKANQTSCSLTDSNRSKKPSQMNVSARKNASSPTDETTILLAKVAEQQGTSVPLRIVLLLISV
jgi:hypothetical protein